MNVATRPSRRRYLIALLLLLLIAVGYIDRIAASIAAPEIRAELGLDAGQLGLLLSAFFWGYAIMMIPSGWLLDTFGKRIVLPIAVCVWTLFAVATAFVQNLAWFIAMRIGLGGAEAPTYPTANLVIREWAPLKERGLFTTILQTGSLFGPAVATAPAAWLIADLGWRPAVVILAAFSILWLAVWLIVYRSPERAKWLKEAEREFIVSNRASSQPEPGVDSEPQVAPMTVLRLLGQRPMLGLMVMNGFQTYAVYFLLTWLPTYMVEERGFDLMGSGSLISLIYFVAMIGVIGLGILTDRFLSLSVTEARRGKRRIAIGALMVVALVPLAAVPFIAHPAGLVIALALALICVSASIGLTFALTNDLVVDAASSGRTYGLLSFGGQLFGLSAPIATGYIVAASGYPPVFILAAVLLFVGAVTGYFFCNRVLQPSQSANVA